MKVAVAGKGGSGKTTTSGTLSRAIASNGYDVLAVDDDDDPNLSVALGIPRSEEVTPLPDHLIDRLDPSDHTYPYQLTTSPEEIIEEYGIEAPEGVRLLKAGRVQAGSGCFGTSHVTARLMVANVEMPPETVTILDLPNGTEHLGLGTARDVDEMLIVVEPDRKSLETVQRTLPLAQEMGVPKVRVVANKIRTEDDRETVEDYCADHDLDVTAVVPHDDAVRRAEMEGSAPIDYDPESPAVQAIRELAEDFGARLSTAHGNRA